MSWEMTLFGRDAAYIVRNPARDGKHRYSYTAYFYEYVTRDITATRTFHSLADAKGYIEHYIGA